MTGVDLRPESGTVAGGMPSADAREMAERDWLLKEPETSPESLPLVETT